MTAVMRVWILVLLAAACAKAPRTRCEVACRREADCAEKLELTDNDFSECVQSCAALERDSRAQPLVEAHLGCVAAARSCEAVLACGQRTPARAHKPSPPLELERTASGVVARAAEDVDITVDGRPLGRLARGQETTIPDGTTRIVARTRDAVVTMRVGTPPPPRAPPPPVRRVVVGPFGAAAEVGP